MRLRTFLINTITMNAPKNIIQYMFGLLLFFIVSGGFNTAAAILGLVGFLAVYTSVYLYNDIVDSEDDLGKKGWKFVASGELSMGSARTIGAVCLAAGLMISFFVGHLFVLAVVILVLLNFLHSSPYTRLKKRFGIAIPNMVAIEYIKFSLGWIAMGTGTARFPFWVFLLMSAVYVLGYRSYKFHFSVHKVNADNVVIAVLYAVFVFSAAAAILVDGFFVPVPLMLVLGTAIAVFAKRSGWWSKNMVFMTCVGYALLLVALLSFASLLDAQIYLINNSLAALI
jgi:hypothetical protein